MPNTFTLIASSTVGAGGASTITFSSIPNTYTDLLLRLSARSDGADDYGQVVINSSSANITRRFVIGTGSGLNNNSFSNNSYSTQNPSGYTANTFASYDLYIPNYAGSNYKSMNLDAVTENNATAASAILQAVLWSSTSAITSISVNCNVGNYVQYSTAYLYGVIKS